MPEPLIHFAIPFASLTLAGIDRGKAFLISILALTPDLDILLLTHRSPTHSLIPITAVALIAYLLLSKTPHRTYILLGSLSLLSHIALDAFTWYTPILWPIWDQSLRILIDLKIHIASQPTILFNPQLLTQPTIFETIKTIEGNLITSQGLIISTILLLPTLIQPLQNKLNQKKPIHA